METVDLELVGWVIKQFEEVSDGEKNNFLQILKNDPEKFTDIIIMSLTPWIIKAALELKKKILLIPNRSALAEAITQGCKIRFAKELEAVS